MIWFTADLHFGHKNILTFTGRPFKDVLEMDEGIIKKWNEQVSRGDTVYVLGDFSFHKAEHTSTILSRLMGNKVLIKGNHDHSKVLKKTHGWAFVRDYYELKRKQVGVHAVLSHFPFEVWHNSHHGSYHLHGHSHGTLPSTGRRLDVGIDTFGIERGLLSLDEIKEHMEAQEIKFPDHHSERTT